MLQKFLLPATSLKPSESLQVMILNGLSLFFGFFMLLVTINSLTHKEHYNLNMSNYLLWHNFVVGSVFIAAFLLGKTKHYKMAPWLFHTNFFIGATLTVMNIGSKDVYLEVIPYFGLQVLMASYLYRRNHLGAHFVLFSATNYLMYNQSPEISFKDFLQVELLSVCFFAIILAGYILRKRSLEELEQERAKVLNSSRLATLGEVSGGIAHEINNPLEIISGSIAVLKLQLQKSNFTDQKVFNRIETIDKTCTRISNIIKSLRAFSRDGSNDEFSSHDIHDIIEGCLDIVNEKLSFHHVKLHYSRAEDILVDCRPSEISQVLFNLICNALDAITDSDDPKWIKIHTYTSQDHLHIKVIDSGYGIPEEHKNKVLTPFYTTKEIGKGTGLGLSISSQVVASHNGELNIELDDSHTCFHITLPLGQQHIQKLAA